MYTYHGITSYDRYTVYKIWYTLIVCTVYNVCYIINNVIDCYIINNVKSQSHYSTIFVAYVC